MYMAKVRKQIYLEAEQNRRLKRLARQLEISEAEVIRRSLEGANLKPASIDERAWKEEIRFLAKRSRRKEETRRGRKWTRDEIYEERLARVSD